MTAWIFDLSCCPCGTYSRCLASCESYGLALLSSMRRRHRPSLSLRAAEELSAGYKDNLEAMTTAVFPLVETHVSPERTSQLKTKGTSPSSVYYLIHLGRP
jgi:hypothetical protein